MSEKRKTIAQHAADVLRESKNPGVCYGDCGLLDMIAARVDKEKYFKLHPRIRHTRILNALEGSKLFDKKVWCARQGRSGNQSERAFYLKTKDN